MIVGFLPQAAEVVRWGGWGQTLRRNAVCSFGAEGALELLHPRAAFLGHVARTHRVSTKLPLNDTFPVPFPTEALLQGSSALCSQLKLLISPAHVYYPFYLMHYYVLILHETERKRLSDSLDPKGKFLYMFPAFGGFFCFLFCFVFERESLKTQTIFLKDVSIIKGRIYLKVFQIRDCHPFCPMYFLFLKKKLITLAPCLLILLVVFVYLDNVAPPEKLLVVK